MLLKCIRNATSKAISPLSLLQQKELTKDEADTKEGGVGVDDYLGRAKGNAWGCSLHCFCSPGTRPGACPRQLWAELIFLWSVICHLCSPSSPSLCLNPGSLSSSSFTAARATPPPHLLGQGPRPQPLRGGEKLLTSLSPQWELIQLS